MGDWYLLHKKNSEIVEPNHQSCFTLAMFWTALND